MNWFKMFIICGLICGSICGMIGKNLTEDKLKQLIADKIIEPNFDLALLTDGKQDSPNSFFQWILSFFSSSSTNEVMESNKCSECSCGKSNQLRVSGGTETGVNQYPWMAVLFYKSKIHCGGSLINDRYVLTAAKCTLIEKFESNLLVRLLEHDLSTLNESESIDRRVKTMMIHPDFNLLTLENDIALLELAQPVEFVGILNPICLPTPGLSYDGEFGELTGFGKTQYGAQYPNILQEVSFYILTHEKCFEKLNSFTNNMICTASFYDQGEGFCDGDGGGPLNVLNRTTKIYHIVGVSSNTENCTTKGRPDVYTRVSNYETWINNNTMNACKCS